MFRLTTLRRTASILTITALAATAVHAQSASDNVTVDRGQNEETGNFEMTREVTGTNGSVTTQRICGEGETEGLDGCVRVKTFTGVDGQTATKEQLIIRGPQRTRAFSRATNPNGDQRRFLRRWRN